jgi:hypothetical protein
MKQWERAEAPLRDLDAVLAHFARRHHMALKANECGWPCRTLEWTTDIDRMIQVYLEDEHALTYTLWICAKQDRAGERHLRALALRESSPIDEIQGELEEILATACAEVNSWSASDLEFSVKLPKRGRSGGAARRA